MRKLYQISVKEPRDDDFQKTRQICAGNTWGALVMVMVNKSEANSAENYRIHSDGDFMLAVHVESGDELKISLAEDQKRGRRIKVSLQELSRKIREINAANGWDLVTANDYIDPYKIPAVLALIHSEVSEALEGFRKSDTDNVLEELADILIRTLDLAGGLTGDFDSIVNDKLKKNRNRGHKHGGKRI